MPELERFLTWLATNHGQLSADPTIRDGGLIELYLAVHHKGQIISCRGVVSKRTLVLSPLPELTLALNNLVARIEQMKGEIDAGPGQEAGAEDRDRR